MNNNDVLRSLRHALNVPDAKLVEIIANAGLAVPLDDVRAYLRKEDEPGYRECPHEVLSRFLDGLVVHKRGPRAERTGEAGSRPSQPAETPVTNNLVLKKLRVAFELKDTDLIALIEKSGALKITKSELGAFFRKPDHRNYRECGDQFLRNLLRALCL